MLVLDALLDVISYTDPASGKQGEGQIKRTRARMACVTIGQDSIGRIFTLEAWAGRFSTDEYIERLIQTHTRWHAQRFGIEANGMQVLFGDTVRILVEMKGYEIPFEPIWQPTNVKKEWRNRTRLQPLTAHGRLFLQPDQFELRAELLAHPNYPTVDLVDALATACSMLPARQRQNQRMEADLKNLAAHLRAQGAPAAYIAKRIEELRQQYTDQALDAIALPLATRP